MYTDYWQNETPFKHIDIGNYSLMLYWSKSKGIYGYQCLCLVFEMGEGFIYTSKSGGYGYCKESQETARALRHIGIAPAEMVEYINKYCHDTIKWGYKVGGNYYVVPKNKTKKLKEENG